MNILIVENDFSFAVEVEMLIKQLGFKHLATIANGVDALKFIGETIPDLILMDIDLNGFLSGIDIAKKIHSQKIPVIFMTAFNDDLVYQEAMGTNPFGYIVKPFDKISLRSHIDLVSRKVNALKKNDKPYIKDCFFIKVNEMLKRVDYKDVCWIQSDRNYADIHLEDRRYSAKISLSKLEEQLNTKDFIRIHKQFIINLQKIDAVTTQDVIINGKNIPLGNKFKDEFLKRLNKI